MSYSIESLQDDCYEGTTVLKNKFNLTDENQLDMMERNITSILIAKAMIDITFENVDFSFYKKLHSYIFSDIYEWAGTVRKVEMSKKSTAFCPVEDIEKRALNIFDNLKKNNYFKDLPKYELINSFTDLYCDLNYLHPFREGNGRIQRLFLSMLLKSINKTLDFSKIDSDLLMIATIKSVSGDIFLLKDIFNEHIK